MNDYHHPLTSGPSVQRWHDIAYWALLAMACAVMLVMNVLTPYKEDDMGFTLIDGVWTPIRSLGDLLQSCRNHYLGTNGRFSDLIPTLFAAFLGKGAFNVCNALVFTLLAHLLSLLSTGRRSITAVAMFLAVVGTCYPVPGETMLWMAGSANYLWAITTSLLLVYCLTRPSAGPVGWTGGVALLLGAMIAGSFNEATSFGFLAGLVIYYAVNRHRFDRRAAVALAGYLAGVLIIMGSPAAWSRAATDGGIVTNLPLADLLGTRWFIFYEKAWRFYLPIIALAVVIVALLLKRGRMVRESVWTYIFICLSLVMFALGLLHERAYAPWVTVALLIIVTGVDALLARWPWMKLALIGVSLALAIFTFARGIKMLHAYKNLDEQISREITAAPSQAVLHEYIPNSYNRFIKPMNYQSSNFFGHEAVYRAYYGKSNVQFVNDSVYARFHEQRLLDGARLLPASCDRPDILGNAYLLPNQSYIAVELLTGTLPATPQMARYYPPLAPDSVSPRQQRQQQDYGIRLDYSPAWFYPMEYQGKGYLICARPSDVTTRLVFPLAEQEVTLTLAPR